MTDNHVKDAAQSVQSEGCQTGSLNRRPFLSGPDQFSDPFLLAGQPGAASHPASFAVEIDDSAHLDFVEMCRNFGFTQDDVTTLLFQELPPTSLCTPSQFNASTAHDRNLQSTSLQPSTVPDTLLTSSSNQHVYVVEDLIDATQSRGGFSVPSTEPAAPTPVPSFGRFSPSIDPIITSFENIPIDDDSTTLSSIASPTPSFAPNDYLHLSPSPVSARRSRSKRGLGASGRVHHPGGDEYNSLKHVAVYGVGDNTPSPSASSSSSMIHDPHLLSPTLSISRRQSRPNSFSGPIPTIFAGTDRGRWSAGASSARTSRSLSPLPSVFIDDGEGHSFLNFQDSGMNVSVEHGDPGSRFPPISPESSPRIVKSTVGSKAMRKANREKRRRDASFQCNTCLENFTTKFSLERHTDVHLGIRYSCLDPDCNVDFGNSSDRHRHMNNKHHRDRADQECLV